MNSATGAMHLPDDDDFARPMQPVRGYAESARGRKGPVLVAFVGLLLAMLVIVTFALSSGLRDGGREGPPVLMPEQQHIKIRPSDPGGVTIPDQDKQIYDVIEPDVAAQVQTAPEAQAGTVEPASGEGIRIVVADDAGVDLPPVQDLSIPSTPAAETAEPVVPVPTPSRAATSSRQEPTVDQPLVVESNYYVQIASFREAASAERAWREISQRHGNIVGQYAPDVSVVDVPGRGTRHRLRIAGFAERGDATSVCNLLKSRGQECLVVSR